MGPIILPLVALLLQAPQRPPVSEPPDTKPVRVWLASSSQLLRGDPVRVYVQTAADGYLVVLHRRTDGRIEVLFPGNPADDPFVRAGTYEIRDAGDRESFVVAEPDGTGLILAALSPQSYRFDEFVRSASWAPDALVPSWSGADAEGALGDVVQRMLGDGYFNYDVVAYTVAPRPYAMQDTVSPYPFYPSCVECTFIGFQLIIAEPVFVGAPRFRRHARFAPPGAPSSDQPMHVMALSIRPAGAGILPRSPRSVVEPRTAASPPIRPRSRLRDLAGRDRGTTAVRAIPLGPGRPVTGGRPANAGLAARNRRISGGAAPMPFREVRLSLSPAAAPAPTAPPPATAERASAGLLAVPPGSRAAVVEHVVAAAPRSRVAGGLPAPSAAQPVPRARSAGGAATAGRAQGMSVPAAAWHATGRRH